MTGTFLIPVIGLFLCGAGGLILHVFSVRPVKLCGIVLLYLGGGVLLLNVCSFQMCAALFICGVGSVVLLGTGSRIEADRAARRNSGRGILIFRLLLAVMLGIISFAASERLYFWIPVRRTVLFVCIWISLMSLFSLAFDDVTLNRFMHLQCICLAFTLCYIYVENSVLVFACFAAINLLLAFGGAVLNSGRESFPSGIGDAEQ